MSVNELFLSTEIGLIYGLVALGIYFSFRVLNFTDLTCDGSFVLGAAVCAILLKFGMQPAWTLFIACAAGAIAGWLTGMLNTKFKISDLLSGIIVSFMLYSINIKIMQGMPNITLLNEATIFTAGNSMLILLAIMVCICAALIYVLNTDFGLSLRSIGQNAKLAKNCGVNVARMTIIGLAISNGLIALSGALFCQQQGFADVSSGVGTVIIGLAAVIIGERLIARRSIWLAVISCIVGSIAYRLVISFALHCDLLGLETQDLNLITGILLIVLLMLRKRGANVSFA
jgi:putative ABC transport system permease protein